MLLLLRLHHLEPVTPDSDFYVSAPLIAEGRAAFSVPVEQLWALLDDIDFPPWRAEWLTAPPRGDGSRRMLRMGGRHLNAGYFTRFEPFREMRFYLGELASPGVRALAAVMWFDTLGPTRSAIRWRVAVKPGLLAKRTRPVRWVTAIANPVMSLGMKIVFGYGLRHARAKASR
ncbi:hypothetical protein MSTE_04917 [Mycobacteroides stephanolepidis]|uniref:Polyketide cyclase n=1 Tax=[Mycobacterium] stephanolepidis TaxID=1520670 RepID=A0A1Z4F4T5_9MYCO|nr:hypothetical protein [[Mycobacterium] stephanolepidis]BAY00209.1 hypothetical protein MSTE_04917 [[Mycobacterium] stephanolepidis]